MPAYKNVLRRILSEKLTKSEKIKKMYYYMKKVEPDEDNETLIDYCEYVYKKYKKTKRDCDNIYYG